MKCIIVIWFSFCAVLSAPSTHNNEKGKSWSWGYVNETTTIDSRRNWGYLNEPTTEKQQQKEQKVVSANLKSTTTEYPIDPCASNPTTPSFKAPGRRISEEKCEEYVYNIKLREKQILYAEECSEKNGIRLPSNAIGGRSALPGEFPHMGALGWISVTGAYIFKCGSTLISTKFVMTAGHCIRSPPDSSLEDLDPKIVRLNEQNLFRNSHGSYLSSTSDRNISRIIIHPKYEPPKKYYDIALIELASKVHFMHSMQPACLWHRLDTGDFGNKVSLTGWGVLAPDAFEISPYLQAANVEVIESAQCDHLLEEYRNRHWLGLTENQLCAGRLEGGVDACKGDSGGPLQFRKPIYSSAARQGTVYYVIGVTSFGIGCAMPNHLGIYTRVSSFIDWIEEIVWK